jgi:chromosomal replication initiation ATPase DnaA
MRERAHSFSNFSIGRANQLAYLSIKRTLNNIGKEINPLFIYGRKGFGKTHLMHAVMDMLKDEDVLSIDCAELEKIPEKRANVLIFENFNFLPEEIRKSVVLSEYLEGYIAEHKQVYLTSLYPPEELNLSEKLIALIKRGLTVPIFRPDAELVTRIFKMLGSNYELDLSDDVVQFLSGFPYNDIQEIENVIKKLDILRDASTEITINTVKEYIVFDEIAPEDKEAAPTYPEDSEFFSFVKELHEGTEHEIAERKDAKAIREEYLQKLYIWKMKGFSVRRLERVIDKPIENIIQEFVAFTSDVQRLIELHKIYGGLEKAATPAERDYLEKKLFDPDAIFEVAQALKRIEERKKQKDEYNRFLDRRLSSKNFVILPSNRDAFGILKRMLADGKPLSYPVYIFGAEGCGKTHLLTAFTKRMQALFPERVAVYIPAAFLALEAKSRYYDEDMKTAFLQNLEEIDAIFLDDIEKLTKGKESRAFLAAILRQMTGSGKQLVVAGSVPHKELFIEADLKVMLAGGMSVAVEPLRKKDRSVIITNLFANKKLPLSDDLRAYLSEHLEGTFTEIKQHIESIIRRVVEEEKELTIDNISGYPEVSPEVVGTQEDEEMEVVPEAAHEQAPHAEHEKVLLKELDLRWPRLQERIFEEFEPEG